MKYNELVEAAASQIEEIMPWDGEDYLAQHPNGLIVDIRQPEEFQGARIEHSINAPRGVLEQCCEWDYAETIPALAAQRDQPLLVVCRSGHRSALATLTLRQLGFTQATSLKLGLKGWNDADLPLINDAGKAVDPDDADDFFNPPVSAAQRKPR